MTLDEVTATPAIGPLARYGLPRVVPFPSAGQHPPQTDGA